MRSFTAVRPNQASYMFTNTLRAPYFKGRYQKRSGMIRIFTAASSQITNDNNNTSSAGDKYNDSITDIAFIALCRIAYGNLAGWQSPRDWLNGSETYTGMVEVSRALMKGRTASQQREAVIAGFPQIPTWFRKLFPYSKWGAEANARLTLSFFSWLVGPMKIIDVEINEVHESSSDIIRTQRSGVHIERCRYLSESGCVGMCVNLCKSPVQTFFTEQLGMPLTMEPNFEDYSCFMTFGKRPPPLKYDVVQTQGCLAACATGAGIQFAKSDATKCHKLE